MFCIILSIICPILGLIVPFLGFSHTITATLVGIFLIGGPEVFLILGMVLAGKQALTTIKQKALSWFGITTIPQPVGRLRYNVGLTLLVGSILINWALQYLSFFIDIPEHTYTLVMTTFIFDIIMIASIFVLGPQFWDKLKRLFVWEAGVE